MANSPRSWVGRGAKLLDIRIEGLWDQAFGEDCLLGVCLILGVPHHAQFLRVHEAPDPEDSERTVQAGNLDPQSRYADMQQFYESRRYQTVDLTVLGFRSEYAVMIHPF